MTKQQEFRKQTEEAKFEAFSLMCKKVTDLEKENAELKDILTSVDCLENAYSFGRKEGMEQSIDQLTKAREIIKELLDTQSRLDPYRNIFKDRILKAEQFLKE